ncbi:endonuclease V [Candidatus Sumerlaeota bacterium]|nr:endonuclease V [Candidatus Sumerlaeota bacterium]
MKFPRLHPWPHTVPEAREIQTRFAASLDLSRDFALREGMLVAGVDVSYERRAVDCHAAIAVLRWPEWEMVECATATLPSPFPYVPGFLSFREGPVVLRALRRLRCTPDLFLVDSHGTAHPRRFGSASHLGLWFGRPTIGCAKSRLCGTHREPGMRAGSAVALRESEEQIGWVLRSRDRVKPIFISPGHLITMDSALATARQLLGRYRILEPIRAAHRVSNEVRREH